jgi:hypothetical protein
VSDEIVDRFLRKYFYLIRPYFDLPYGNVSVVRLYIVHGKMADEWGIGKFWTEVVLV